MKRITFMIDDDNLKAAHKIQSEKIKETNQNCSFSSVINEMMRRKK